MLPVDDLMYDSQLLDAKSRYGDLPTSGDCVTRNV